MARLYADANVRLPLVRELRRRGHSVVVPEGGLRRLPDPEVVRAATAVGAAVVTYNRSDFLRIHRSGLTHAGIIVSVQAEDDEALARLVDAAIREHSPLDGKLIRIRRPPGRTEVES